MSISDNEDHDENSSSENNTSVSSEEGQYSKSIEDETITTDMNGSFSHLEARQIEEEFEVPGSGVRFTQREGGAPSSSHIPRSNNRLVRRVQIVSKRAALASKRKIWDTNDAGIDAAQHAVEQWEASYHSLRSFFIQTSKSAVTLYQCTKNASQNISHSLLVPVRDTVLLPAFSGAERVVDGTVAFLQSDQARVVAESTLSIAKQTPFVGEPILVPALVTSANLVKLAWETAQYPIPSRESVRHSVDALMTGTKWCISTSSRELLCYIKILDTTVIRTLSQTQWSLLGSGPYANLPLVHRKEVLDHLCERYFSIQTDIGRYEFIAHVKQHNRTLYHDLVTSGLLSERGEALTNDDEWLSACPNYWDKDDDTLFWPMSKELTQKVRPMWFYLPNNEDGGKPGKDSPWLRFGVLDECNLESKFKSLLRSYDEGENDSNQPLHASSNATNSKSGSQPYPTVAKWYELSDTDAIVEQNRHAVCFAYSCSKSEISNPLAMVRKPLLWRFNGDGDEVRRASWVLDTNHGLQPYGHEAAAILEDAYLYLRKRNAHQEDKVEKHDSSVILTVQVVGPDGEETQLVQFRSLTQVTAVQKTVGGGLALFKRRVYRGVKEMNSSNDIDLATCNTKNPNDLLAAECKVADPEHDSSHTEQNDTINHLILVVHGIGEMITPAITGPSLVDCCASLRKNHASVFATQQAYEHGQSERVEYLPIEWHEAFSVYSRRLNVHDKYRHEDKVATISDISLETIPHLRQFANDTMLDSK